MCVKDGGAIKIKDVADGCSITREPEPQCSNKRRLTRLQPSIPGLWAPYTHRDCTHNEYVSIRNRVIGKVPEPTKKGLSSLRYEARVIGRQLPEIAPMTREKFCEHYSGKRRTRYERACLDLEKRPLELPRDARISAFVKAEKMNPTAKVNPDPRMIQARNARYNIEVGVYLKPIEHHLYRLKTHRGTPMLAKGRDAIQKGRDVAEKWGLFTNPVAVSFDGSRWDQHIDREVLKIEHSVYLRCHSDPVFARLLREQLDNKCTTLGGWRYKAKGKRMSGDMNTALGNCLLMCLMVMAYFRELGIDYDFYDDGDDVLVFFEREHLEKVQSTCHEAYLQFGQEVKVENIAYSLEQIEFCQTRPVKDNTGEYVMVANWRKVVSHSASDTRYWADASRADMAYSVGQCLLALYPGMPILQNYAQALCRGGGKLSPGLYDTDWVFKFGMKGARKALGTLSPEPTTAETRASFEKAFGVPIEQQLTLEAMLDKWEIPTGLEDVGCEVSEGWVWDYALGHVPTAWEW